MLILIGSECSQERTSESKPKLVFEFDQQCYRISRTRYSWGLTHRPALHHFQHLIKFKNAFFHSIEMGIIVYCTHIF